MFNCEVNSQIMLNDINPGSAYSSPFNVTNLNGTICFGAYDIVNGGELWKTDGTTSGTVLIKDIKSGSGNSIATTGGMSFVNSNGTLFFTADDGINGTELWKSDGTAAGTMMVKDIRPGMTGSFPNGSNPNNFLDINGTLFFSATDGINGSELWKSDGTAAGTVMVKDIVPGPNGSGPQYLANLNGLLYFGTGNGSHELWQSDGTTAGTVLVKAFPGANSVGPYYLKTINNILFFRASDGINGEELWKSDGTTAGTVLVKDIKVGTMYSNGLPYYTEFCNVNGTLYFAGDDGINGIELWKSDGTTAGTFLVKDIFSGTSNSSPSYLTNVNGILFFVAEDATNGIELWKSDGTVSGTVLVKNILTGTLGASPSSLLDVNGTLYFSALASPYGRELWKSDGSVSGTVNVTDIWPGSGDSYPTCKLYLNNSLFFTADDGTHGFELWKYDITTAGIQNISESQTDIQIFPNPNNGKFTIEMENSSNQNTDFKIEINNVFGQKVYSENISQPKTHQLNLELSDGIYFVKLTSENKTITRKIIIQ